MLVLQQPVGAAAAGMLVLQQPAQFLQMIIVLVLIRIRSSVQMSNPAASSCSYEAELWQQKSSISPNNPADGHMTHLPPRAHCVVLLEEPVRTQQVSLLNHMNRTNPLPVSRSDV